MDATQEWIRSMHKEQLSSLSFFLPKLYVRLPTYTVGSEIQYSQVTFDANNGKKWLKSFQDSKTSVEVRQRRGKPTQFLKCFADLESGFENGENVLPQAEAILNSTIL